MTSFAASFDSSQPTDPQLAQFVEQAIAQLEAGKEVDVEAIVGPQVEYAERLRALLPTIEGMLGLLPTPSLTGPPAPLAISPSRAELGDFRLIREIGRGGMGTVFEAEQISMGRRVAIKILPFATLADDKSLQRFRNEVRAAAALDHPHIVSVYSVGEQRGIHFYAMRLIQGQSLAEAIDEMRRLRLGEGPSVGSGLASGESREDSADTVAGHHSSSTLTGSGAPGARFRAIAQLGIDAAEALQHAHEQGVIHRDIKPANLLVDTSGKIHVTDFGLARIGADAGLTHTGDVVGTLRYMPPEQAMGRQVAIDHRSDIYSLGVTLYELLTLTPAYDTPHRGELVRQIAFLEPRAPRRIDPTIPVELDTIVLKAMAKEPAARYATAQELADDLRRFLNHQPIKAKPPTLLDRVLKLSRRHSKALPAIGVGLLLLTGILVAALVQIHQSRARALAALEETSELLYIADMRQAFEAWEKGWLAEAHDILDRYDDQASSRRGLEWHMLHSVVPPPRAIELPGHEGGTYEIALFPDGKRLASVGEDGTLRIWDWQAQSELQSFSMGSRPISSVAVSADGRYVAAGANVLTLLDLENNARRRALYISSYNFESIAFSDDGERLAAGVRYHDLVLVSLKKFGIKRIFSGARVSSLEFMRDGLLLAPMHDTRSNPNEKEAITLRDENLKPVREFTFPHGIKVARRSPDGKLIIGGARNSMGLVFDAANGELLATTPRARSELLDVAFAPNSRVFAISYGNGVVEVYEYHKGAIRGRIRPTIATFRAHRADAYSLRFIDNHILATGGGDGRIRIWTLGQDAVKSYSTGRAGHDVKLSPDGSCFAVMSTRGCQICDTASGRVVANYKGEVIKGSTSAWHPDGNQLALCVASADKPIRIIDRTGNLVRSLPHPGSVYSLAFSPDGRLLSSIGDKGVWVREVETGEAVANLPSRGAGWTVAFTPDGKHLAYSSQSGPLTLVKLEDWEPAFQLNQGTNGHSLAFSHDGKWLASGHGDGMIRLWELPAGELRFELAGHEMSVKDMAFSRSGRTLVSASMDGTVRAWSLTHKREFGTLFHSRSPDTHSPESSITRLSLSADGRQLVVSDNLDDASYNVHVWHLGGDAPFQPLE